MKKSIYNQCGKYFAKGFKLKVHTQNVHEIEKIKYESINDILENGNDQHFQKFTKFKCKICRKKLLRNRFLKCIWKISIKNLKNTTVMSKFHTKYWIERTYYSCS